MQAVKYMSIHLVWLVLLTPGVLANVKPPIANVKPPIVYNARQLRAALLEPAVADIVIAADIYCGGWGSQPVIKVRFLSTCHQEMSSQSQLHHYQYVHMNVYILP